MRPDLIERLRPFVQKQMQLMVSAAGTLSDEAHAAGITEEEWSLSLTLAATTIVLLNAEVDDSDPTEAFESALETIEAGWLEEEPAETATDPTATTH